MVGCLGQRVTMSQDISFSFGGQGGSQSARLPQTQPNGSVASQTSTGQSVPLDFGQHPAYSNNAQLPADELSALQGVSPEQVALIARLLQSGALTMPSPSVAPALGASTTSVSADPRFASSRSGDISTSRQDVNMEKEEGELEEGEEPERPRLLARGPHKRRASSGNPHVDAEERVSFGMQRERPISTKVRKISEPKGAQGFSMPPTAREFANGVSTTRDTFDKSAAARKFVLAMHNAGYTFAQLATEVSNVMALRRLYQSLGIPTAAEIEHPAPIGTEASQPESRNVPLRVEPPMSDPRRVPATKKQLPTKSEPPNRAEYVARLAALKAKSASKATEKHVGDLPSKSAISEQSASVQPARPSAPEESGSKTAQSKSKVTTDLVKQRLALHRAREAAKKNAALMLSGPSISSSPVTNSTNSQLHGGLGSGLESIAEKVSGASDQSAAPNQPVIPPVSQGAAIAAPARPLSATSDPHQPLLSPSSSMVGQPFAGLPGLFMAPPPFPTEQVKLSPSATDPGSSSSIAPAPLEHQLPTNGTSATLEATAAPALFSYSSQKPENGIFNASMNTLKRTAFGQSRSSSESERLVIEVSDDDDDEDQPIGGVAFKAIHRKPSIVSNLPLPQNFAAAETSGASTPGSLAELEEKQRAINAMNRKIAELRARKSNGKGHGKIGATFKDGESSAATSKSTLIVSPTGGKPNSPSIADTSESVVSNSVSSPGSAADKSAKSLARDREKAFLQQRLKELQQDMFRRNSQAAASEPPLMSGALPAIGSARESAPLHIDGMHQQSNAVAGFVVGAAAVEEGDVGEDSDGQGVAIDDSKIGPQATTVNASQPENDIAGSAIGGIRPQEDCDFGLDSQDGNARPTSESTQQAAQALATGNLLNKTDNESSLEQPSSALEELNGSNSEEYYDGDNGDREEQDNDTVDNGSEDIDSVPVENQVAHTSNIDVEDDIGQISSSDDDSRDVPNFDADNEEDDGENGEYDPERLLPPITADNTNGNTIASHMPAISCVNTDSLELVSGLQPSDSKQVRDEVREGSSEGWYEIYTNEREGKA